MIQNPQPPTTIFKPTQPLPSNTLMINLRPYGRDRKPGARIPREAPLARIERQQRDLAIRVLFYARTKQSILSFSFAKSRQAKSDL